MNAINILPDYVLSSIYAFGIWHA